MNILVTEGAGFVTILDNLHTGSVQNLQKIIDNIKIIEEKEI